MGFTERSSSCDSMRKKNKSFDQRDNELHHRLKSTAAANEPLRLHMQKLGPMCKSRKTGDTNISHQSLVEDDVDLDQQLGVERCSDDNECMWLSSDCTSPSTFFQEHRLSGPFHLYADDWSISWLSTLANSYLHLDKGSTLFNELRTNSMKYSSLSPEKIIPGAKENIQEYSKGKAGITLPVNSPGTDEMDSSETSSESAKSERLDFNSSSVVIDTERSCFCESLMNLDGEDSKWISDTESELEEFQLSGFPSPSYRSSWGSEVKSSNYSPPVPIEVKDDKSNYDLSLEPDSEAEDLEDFSANEPLFWPFELEQDWSSEEAWKCFSMSPRRGLTKVMAPEGTSLESSTGLQIHVQKMNPKIGCRRKFVISSGSTASKILEVKQRNNNKGVKKISNTPSRLRNSNKVSMEVIPIEMENDHKFEPTETKVPITKPLCEDRNLFQDAFAWNEELPIESVLGLGEFDGHEGVDTDLNEDDFFLEKSL